ncbi:MAG: hypothetical protein ACKO5J_14635 [Rubrivivax sp.]
MRSTITSGGELELRLVDQSVMAPATDEVLIRVEATPINPSDQGLLFGAADLSTLSTGGMVAGLIHDIPTAKELIDRIVAEAEELSTRRLARFSVAAREDNPYRPTPDAVLGRPS